MGIRADECGLQMTHTENPSEVRTGPFNRHLSVRQGPTRNPSSDPGSLTDASTHTEPEFSNVHKKITPFPIDLAYGLRSLSMT